MKKKNDLGLLIGLSLALAIVVFVAQIVTSTDNKFQTHFFQGQTRVGYEDAPDIVTIDISSALAWEGTPKGLKQISWVLFFGIFAGCFVAWKWDYKFATLGTPWVRILLTIGVAAASFVFWWIGYNKRANNLDLSGPFSVVAVQLELSPEQIRNIREKAGSGAYMLEDENGKITSYFRSLK